MTENNLAVLLSSPGDGEHGMDSAFKVLTAAPVDAGRGRVTGKENRSQSAYVLRLKHSQNTVRVTGSPWDTLRGVVETDP